jgi:glutathione peroxidase
MRPLHVLAAASLLVAAGASAEEATSETADNAYAFEFKAQATALYTADGRPWNGPTFEEGQPVRLADYAGHPILVVNTAAHCGYTPQFESLAKVWNEYRDQGLMIIGVHANNFADQGGSEQELAEQCGVYGVDFPQMQREDVVGESSHPFYAWVRGQVPVEELRAQREDFVGRMRARGMPVQELSDEDFKVTGFPSWNFNKVLIDSEGEIVAVFNSGHSTNEVQPELIEAIETTLAAS